ncbi:hypothetical protein ACRALDRAFT_1068746 [Sodiomyces alcalophilus JCM 7366]|uniref:uncharacterized protein n=1 Tax=Sodiomyces alcalophilus JCM 7366 TaxID=591952 RepID=UPI0039B6717D
MTVLQCPWELKSDGKPSTRRTNDAAELAKNISEKSISKEVKERMLSPTLKDSPRLGNYDMSTNIFTTLNDVTQARAVSDGGETPTRISAQIIRPPRPESPANGPILQG